MVTQAQVLSLSGKEGILGQSKAQSHFTGDAVEVWMHSDLPRVLRKETAVY